MKKKTEDLIHELASGQDIAGYIRSNSEEFIDTPLHLHLKKLLSEAGLKASQVADRSQKGEYIYQVFRGTKHPGRDVLLSIALAMELGPDETARILRIARMPLLDARNRRDSILIFALQRKLTVPDANDLLYEFGEPCL